MSAWSGTDWSGKAVSADLILEQLEERIVLDGDWQPVDGFDYEQIGDTSYFRQGDGGTGYDVMFAYDHTTEQWYEHDGHSDTPLGTDWFALGAAGALQQSDGSIVNGDPHVIADGLTMVYDSVENRAYWTSTLIGEFYYDFDHGVGDHEWQQKVDTDTWALTGESSEIWYEYKPGARDLAYDWEYEQSGITSYWRDAASGGGYDALFAYEAGRWYQHDGWTSNPYGTSWYILADTGVVPAGVGLLNGDPHDVGNGLTYSFDWAENRSYWDSTFLGSFYYDHDEGAGNHEYYQAGDGTWVATGDTNIRWYEYGSGVRNLAHDWEYEETTLTTYWRDVASGGGYDAMFAYEAGRWYHHDGWTASPYGTNWYMLADVGVVPTGVGLLNGDPHDVETGIEFQFDWAENRSYWDSALLGQFYYDHDEGAGNHEYYQAGDGTWVATGDTNIRWYEYGSGVRNLAHDWEYEETTLTTYWRDVNSGGGYDALFAYEMGRWYHHDGWSASQYGTNWYMLADVGVVPAGVGLLNGDPHNVETGIEFQFDWAENRSYWDSTLLGQFYYDHDEGAGNHEYYQAGDGTWVATGDTNIRWYEYGSGVRNLAHDWEYEETTLTTYWRDVNSGGGYDALFAYEMGRWYHHDGWSASQYGTNWYMLADVGVVPAGVGLLNGDPHNVETGIEFRFDWAENRSYWDSTLLGQFYYDHDEGAGNHEYYQAGDGTWVATGDTNIRWYEYGSGVRNLAHDWEYEETTLTTYWRDVASGGGYDALFAYEMGRWYHHDGWSASQYGTNWYLLADVGVVPAGVGLLNGDPHDVETGIEFRFDWAENRSYWDSTLLGQFYYDHDEGAGNHEYYQAGDGTWVATGDTNIRWYEYGSGVRNLAHDWEYEETTLTTYWRDVNSGGGYDALFAYEMGRWYHHDGWSASQYGTNWYMLADVGVVPAGVGLLNGDPHTVETGIEFRFDWAENRSYWDSTLLGQFYYDHDEGAGNHEYYQAGDGTWVATGDTNIRWYEYGSGVRNLAHDWEYEETTLTTYWRHLASGSGYDALFAYEMGRWYHHDGWSASQYGTNWYMLADVGVVPAGVGLLNGDPHDIGNGLAFRFDWTENRSRWDSTFLGEFYYDHDEGLGGHEYYQETDGTWSATGDTNVRWYEYGSGVRNLANDWEYEETVITTYWRHADTGGGYDALFAYEMDRWYEHDGWTASPYGTAWYTIVDTGVLPANVGLVNGASHDIGGGITFRLDYAENASYWTHDPIGAFRFDYDTAEWEMNHSRVGSTVEWWAMDAGDSPRFVFDNESTWHSAGDGLTFQYDSGTNRTYWEYDQDGNGTTDQQFYYDNNAPGQWYKYKNDGPQYWSYGESGEEAFPWFLDNNNAPTVSLPATVQEIASAGGTLTFNDANGNLISIADRDAYDGLVRLSLFSSNGTMTLTSGDHLGRLDLLIGDGTDAIRMIGAIEDINLALDGMVYDADGGYSGWAGIFVGPNDLGATGQGGSWGAQGTVYKVDIAVNLDPGSYPSNEAPVIHAPVSPQPTDVETALVFSSENGNAISITDGDTGSIHGVKIVVPYGGDVSLNPDTLGSLNFVDGDGVEDALVFFTGSLADINLALEGLTYTPSEDFSGTTDGLAGFSIAIVDGGIDGTGGPYIVGTWVPVAVDPISDPATITAPDGVFNVSSGGTVTFDGANTITVADPDAGSNDIEVRIKPYNGSLTLAYPGLSGNLTQFGGSATTGFYMVGTVGNINAMLADLVFDATGSTQGWGGLLLVLNDLGSTGGYPNGGVTSVGMVDINVDSATIPDNTAPENTVPTEWQTVENDSSLIFSTGNGNAISIDDAESSGTDPVGVLLYAANGAMTLSTNAGLAFREGTWQDSSYMRIQGNYDAINAALEGMTYTPNAGYTGWAHIEISTWDMGFNAIGAPMQYTDTVIVEVLPADNEAPGTSDPDPEISVGMNEVLSFTGDNEVQISDPEHHAGGVMVKLLTYNGTLHVDNPGGASIFYNDTSRMAIVGTETQVNQALATLTFTPDTDYTGWSELAVVTNDGGPSGGNFQNGQVQLTKVDIAVGIPEGTTPANQLPVFDAFPEDQFVQEDGVLVFDSAHGNLIAASDIDDPTGTQGLYTYRLYASGGTMTLGSTVGLSFTYGDGTDDATLYISGTLEDLNAAVDGLTFTPDQDFALGKASILVYFSDAGYWGLGTDRTDTSVFDTIMITIDPVNDPIGNMFEVTGGWFQSVPGDYQTDANTVLTFSWANENLIQVSDGADEYGVYPSYPGSYLHQEITLTAEHGTITVNTAFTPQFTGIFSVTGNGTDTVTITGAQWDINATFDGMTFTPETDYTGYASILVTSSDFGNVGGENAHHDTDRIDITVGAPQNFPVNEAPMVWVPLTQTIAEDTSVTFSTANENPIVIYDPDSGSDELYYELIATHGTMTLASVSGLSFILGDGTSDYGMRFYGTMDDINAALDGLVFQADAGHEGQAGILVRGHDQGNNGIGNVQWGAGKALVDITPVYNDEPTADPQSVQATEDVPLAITLTGDDGDGAQTQTLTYYLDFPPGDGGALYASEANALARTSPLGPGALAGNTVWYMSDLDTAVDTSFTFHVQDDGGGAEDTSATVTVDVSVVPANDAPVIDNTGTMTFTTITEDNTSNPGNTVAEIILSAGGDRITDVDSGALEGIALYGTVDSSLGSWQYSLDGGTSWVDVGSVSSTSALLLRPTDYIRFAPGGEDGGTASISFVAWDQTAYSAGREVDVSSPGGTTPFSVVSEVAEITITAVNDAPTLTLPGLPGSLDLSFDSDGIVTTDFFNEYDYGYAVAIQSDGKIVVAGSVDNGMDEDFGVVRYNTDGSLDTGFGDGGLVTTVFGDWEAAYSVAIQSDGKIVVAGIAYNGVDDDFGVVRYNTDGTLDTGFGAGGLVTTDFGDDEEATSVAIQSDGKIVVAGDGWDGDDCDFAIARYNTDGSLDTSFDTDGMVTTDLGGNEYAYSVAIQSDGKIVAAGTVYNGGDADFGVVRYNTDGTLDTGFDTDGMVTTDFGSGDDEASSVAIQSDGKIVVAGETWNGSDDDFAIARYNTNGTLDTSFGTGGLVTMDFDTADNGARSVVIQSDGKIVVAGTSQDYPYDAFTVVRYNDDGSLDTGFSYDGLAIIDFAESEHVNSAAIDPDGKIVVFGWADNGSGRDFMVARFNADMQSTAQDTGLVFNQANGNAIQIDDVDSGAGELRVTILSQNGIVDLSTTTGLTFLYGSADESDEIWITGTLDDINDALDGMTFTPTASYTGWGCVSVGVNDLGNTGAGDPTGLGTLGKVDINVGSDPSGFALNQAPVNTVPGPLTTNEDTPITFLDGTSTQISISDADLDADEDTIMIRLSAAYGTLTLSQTTGLLLIDAGSTGIDETSMRVVGTLDDINAALNGMVFTPDEEYSGDEAYVTIGTLDMGFHGVGDGMGGYSPFRGIGVDGDTIAITVYSMNDSPVLTLPPIPGTLDASFGSDGLVTTDFASDSDLGFAMAIDANGKIVVAGYTDNGTDNDFAVARYNADGTLDTSFGTGGMVTTHFGLGDDEAHAVAIDSNGKIVVAGYAFTGTTTDFAVARYNTDGSLDTTFSTDGKATEDFGDDNNRAFAVAIDTNDKIVVGGATQYGGGYSLFGLLRYDTDGDLDTSFGTGGKVTEDLGSFGNYLYDLAIDSSGNIVAAGCTWNGSDNDFALARYDSTGSLDTSFGTGGKVTENFSGNDYIQSVAIDSSGKIVAAGYSTGGSTDYQFALARFETNGSLDTSFDTDGKVTTNFGSAQDVGSSVAIQSDGRIVVAGLTNNGTDYDFALARYHSDGSLDDTLDSDGKVTTDFGSGDDFGRGMAIDANGKIVVAGYASNGTDSDFAVVRYDAVMQSTPISTALVFNQANGNAIQIADVDAGTAEVRVNINAQNGVVDLSTTTGLTFLYGSTNSSDDIFITGTLDDINDALDDLTFTPTAAYTGWGCVTVGVNDQGNTGGGDPTGIGVVAKVDINIGNVDPATLPVNTAPVNTAPGGLATNEETPLTFIDGTSTQISVYDADVVADDDLILVRLWAGYGTLTLSQDDGLYLVDAGSTGVNETTMRIVGTMDDINAALDGMVFTPYADYSGGAFVRIATVDMGIGGVGDGMGGASMFPAIGFDMDVVGITVNPVNDAPVVSIDGGAGSLDTTFGGDGTVSTDLYADDDYGWGMAVQSDGKIVVAGPTENGWDYDIGVLRYNTDGTVDTGFGAAGKILTDLGSDNHYVTSVAIDSSGRIVVAGYGWNGSSSDIFLVRYDTDGNLDTTFDSDGIVTTNYTTWDYAMSLAIQDDGKIVVAGSVDDGSGADIAVLRYDTYGSLDTDFDTDGIVTTDSGTADYGRSVAIQDDGKIVVGGENYNSGQRSFEVVRYFSNGGLDTGFGGSGIVTTDFGVNDASGKSVAIQSDGKIVVAGEVDTGSYSDFGVVRYNSDGSLDTSFAGSGKVLTDLAGDDDFGKSVAIQADGKIVVAGHTYVSGSGWDFGLVRYDPDGNVDTSFGSNGIETTDFGGNLEESAYSVVIQDNGKIVVGGEAWNGFSYDFAVARYAPALDYTEGDGSVVICNDISITDVDNTTLVSAVIEISGNYQSTEDVLALDGAYVPGGISSVVWNSTYGTLTITGTATLAEYETMLEHITYENTSAIPNTDPRTITWTVNDGTDDSVAQESIITVTALPS